MPRFAHNPDNSLKLGGVRKGTAQLARRWYCECMAHKHASEESGRARRASVKKELAKPRMARSARIAERNLDASRIAEDSSVTMPGTVDKIISFRRRDQSERAQIAVEGADRGYRELRIENTLIDENGDDVKLKKGGHVEVTVSAKHD